MTGPDVAVGFLQPGEWSDSFGMSLLHMCLYEAHRNGVAPYLLNNRVASGGIVRGRNEVVRDFLDKTGCDWLLFVDSDMGFEPDTLERLLAAADPDERPIVGALCFGMRRERARAPHLHAQSFRMFPTVYLWREFDDEVGFQVVADYPRDQLVQVSSSGAACVLIHRSALTKIADRWGHMTWFEEVTHPKGPTHFSEDMSFFIRAASVDLPVFVDTSVKTSHDKGGVFLTEETWDDQQQLVALREQNEPGQEAA